MKSVRLYGAGDLRLHDEDWPVPGPGEALVKVTAVGVCGSDLHWFSESSIGDANLDHPLVMGHEFAGVVVSSPPGGLPSGTRVAVDPAIPCGACEFCLEGNPNFCERLRFAGHSIQDGALREAIAWPGHLLHPLPASLSDSDGALLEPLGVALHSVDLGHVRPGSAVGVYGCGPIGLLILQVARLAGAARLFATDPLPHRLAAAQALGAEVFPVEEGREAALILNATGGRGVNVAFEAAGEDAAVEVAIKTARPGARVVLAGIPTRDQTCFTASEARRKGLTLKLVRRMKHTYPRALALAAVGRVDLRSLVTHCFPLEASQEAFQLAARREGIKVVIESK